MRTRQTTAFLQGNKPIVNEYPTEQGVVHFNGDYFHSLNSWMAGYLKKYPNATSITLIIVRPDDGWFETV